jgi:pimeloyl-ACP methyl ester carboxylesterase
MNVDRSNIQSDRVTTEGDDLYYEVRGQGQPLLMIPGGGGDGGSYSLVADILSSHLKVITYDRRANSRSTMNDPHHFNIAQQSRDAEAVIHATGEKSAFVFGNSSGAVIALDMAATQPQAVKAIVAHEPPLASVHPNAEKWQKFFQNVYSSSLTWGSTIAMLKFTFGIGVDFQFSKVYKAVKAARKAVEKSSQPYIDRKILTKFFLEQELLPVTNYLPDIEAIKRNRVRVFMAAGKRSLEKKRFYAETAQILAKQLGCEMVVFPGHHGSFFDMPSQWAQTLRDTLSKAEK